MVTHSLAIERFETHLALVGLREDAARLEQEVGRAVRDLLPAAIGRMLAPLLGERAGVLRINRIAVALRLGRGDAAPAQLADRLAREIALAVADRAAEAGATVEGEGLAFWPDHISFAAAYLAHRLRLAPGPDWAFAEFHALRELAPHEAAVELIAARPAILAALARRLGVGAAPALAARLPEATAAGLVRRLLDGVTGGVADDAAGLAAMVAAVPAGAAAMPGRAAIEVAATACGDGVAAEDEAVRLIVQQARLAVALAVLRAAVLRIWGREPVAADLTADAAVHLPDPARGLLREAVLPVAGTTQARDALIRAAVGMPRRDAAPVAAQSNKSTPAAVPARVITSRLAGIGLLLPTLLAFRLPALLSPAALHWLLVAAADPRDAAAARQDPLLAALAPFDPRDEVAFPPLPDALRSLVPTPWREELGEGAAAWAAGVMHGFAADLRGLEGSSPAYLRRQFLMRPGALHVESDRLALVLDPLPLGIMLRLSGPHGWSGALPHGARLRIEIRDD